MEKMAAAVAVAQKKDKCVVGLFVRCACILRMYVTNGYCAIFAAYIQPFLLQITIAKTSTNTQMQRKFVWNDRKKVVKDS